VSRTSEYCVARGRQCGWYPWKGAVAGFALVLAPWIAFSVAAVGAMRRGR
jgi:hypothetical protein